MEISSPVEKKIVTDYDIEGMTGITLSLTIDTEAGDTFNRTPDVLEIYLSPKPHRTDPTKVIPAEEFEVQRAHVFCIRKRTREVLGLTPEQQIEWQKSFEDMGSKTH